MPELLISWVDTWVVTTRMGRALGGVPTQGSLTYHSEAALDVIGRELVISTNGDGNAGSGV